MFGVTAECGGGRRRARKAEQGPGRLSSGDASLGADQQRGGRARSHEGWHGEEGARGGGCGPRFWQRPWSGGKAVVVTSYAGSVSTTRRTDIGEAVYLIGSPALSPPVVTDAPSPGVL